MTYQQAFDKMVNDRATNGCLMITPTDFLLFAILAGFLDKDINDYKILYKH